MTCPNAPKRGHRPGSQRHLQCPYCGSSSSTSVRRAPGRGKHSRAATGTAPATPAPPPSRNVSPPSTPALSPTANAELTRRAEQLLGLLLVGTRDLKLEQALKD